MIQTDPTWMNTIAEKFESSDLSVIAGFVCIVLFMKFNRHEARNEANRFLSYCLGIGFLMIVAFRIYKGVF